MTISKPQAELTMRKKQALATREKIYNTAFRLLTERGFENITVDEICSESGVAKGFFYHYFKSKDDIVIENNVARSTTTQNQMRSNLSPEAKKIELERKEDENKNERLKLLEYLDKQAK